MCCPLASTLWGPETWAQPCRQGFSGHFPPALLGDTPGPPGPTTEKALGKAMRPAASGLRVQKERPGPPLLCVRTGQGRPPRKQRKQLSTLAPCFGGRAQELGLQGAGPRRTQSRSHREDRVRTEKALREHAQPEMMQLWGLGVVSARARVTRETGNEAQSHLPLGRRRCVLLSCPGLPGEASALPFPAPMPHGPLAPCLWDLCQGLTRFILPSWLYPFYVPLSHQESLSAGRGG